LGSDLYTGHKIKNLFQPPKYAVSDVPVTNAALPSPSRHSLSDYRSLLVMRSIWPIPLIPWSQLCISGHVDGTALLSPPRGEWPALTSVTHCEDALDGGPCIHLNNRPLLSLSLEKIASSTSPQKPPTTYTWFGPHTDLIFRGTIYTREWLIHKYIQYTVLLQLLI